MQSIQKCLCNLPEQLINEDGGEFGFVFIWREGDSGGERTGTVGEWLSHPDNQSGTWMIDGGWGGPPGPIHVRWDELNSEWINGGYLGVKFR
jgi:hypothetical protein